MAHDLALGRTPRDWSCGRLLVTPRPDADRPWVTVRDPQELGEEARSRVAGAASLAVRLSRAGRLPAADKKQFAQFHRKWTDFYSSQRGKFGRADVLVLWNFAVAAKKLRERLDAFEVIARTPARAPSGALVVGPRGEVSPPASGGARWWAIAGGAALTLLGLGLFRASKLA